MKRGHVLVLVSVGAALAGVATVRLSAALGGQAPLVPYESARAVSAGEVLYAAHCAACHGNALEGQPNWQERDADGYLPAPPHDATGHTWHHPDALLFEITKHGTEAVVGGGYRSRMMAFEGILSDDEIAATLAYIKSTWPRHVIDTHNRINAEAR